MLHTDIDAILCLLWILTYTLVLIGTEKYKYPLISPISQAIIAPLEFAVLFQLVTIEMVGTNHVFLSYLFWAILEVVIIVLQIRHGFIRKKYVLVYLLFVVAITLLMCYLVAYKGHQLFFALFNTFVGEIIWLLHILKRNYPMKPMVLVMFLAKFVADSMSVPVYFGRGSWVCSILGALLPVLDFIFIHVYFLRIANNDNQSSKQK